MNRPLHIIIDNTFPGRLVRELEGFWRSSFPEWTIRHENDVAKASTKDLHWIPRLKDIERTGDWLILTADSGKNDRKKNEKLPVICRKHGHAYLLVSRSLQRFDAFKSALSAIWPNLPLVVEACRKAKHETGHVTLAPLNLRGGLLSYRLQYRGKPIEDWLGK